MEVLPQFYQFSEAEQSDKIRDKISHILDSFIPLVLYLINGKMV